MQIDIKNESAQVYNLDIVFCIDNTANMQPVHGKLEEWLDVLHAMTLQMTNDLRIARVSNLRVRFVLFRDWIQDDTKHLVESPFFQFPQEKNQALDFFLNNSCPMGGGSNDGDSSLEALSAAINSRWSTTKSIDRHIIILISDEPGLPLEETRALAGTRYPKEKFPADFRELTDWWYSRMCYKSRRLLVWAPEEYPWRDIRDEWEESQIHFSHTFELSEKTKWLDLWKSVCAAIVYEN